jgi:hypothetical protein
MPIQVSFDFILFGSIVVIACIVIILCIILFFIQIPNDVDVVVLEFSERVVVIRNRSIRRESVVIDFFDFGRI